MVSKNWLSIWKKNLGNKHLLKSIDEKKSFSKQWIPRRSAYRRPFVAANGSKLFKSHMHFVWIRNSVYGCDIWHFVTVHFVNSASFMRVNLQIKHKNRSNNINICVKEKFFNLFYKKILWISKFILSGKTPVSILTFCGKTHKFSTSEMLPNTKFVHMR